MKTIRLFLDTEFTDLIFFPRLLSVGIVGDGIEFYGEVTDRKRLESSSYFVKETVLPQFGKIPGAACSYQDLCHRLAVFFKALTKNCDYIIVAYDYCLDWELVREALEHAGIPRWITLSMQIIPVDVNHIIRQPEAESASQNYFQSQRFAQYSRHHALCDARALKLAHEAGSRGENH